MPSEKPQTPGYSEKNRVNVRYTRIIEELKLHPSLAEKRGVTSNQLEALYLLACQLYYTECFDKAADLFRLLCFYQPGDAKNWMGLGGAHQHIENHEAALAAFIMAYLHDPQNPEPRLYAAHSLIDLKNLPLALESAELAVELCARDHNHDATRKNAISLCSALKDYLKSVNHK